MFDVNIGEKVRRVPLETLFAALGVTDPSEALRMVRDGPLGVTASSDRAAVLLRLEALVRPSFPSLDQPSFGDHVARRRAAFKDIGSIKNAYIDKNGIQQQQHQQFQQYQPSAAAIGDAQVNAADDQAVMIGQHVVNVMFLPDICKDDSLSLLKSQYVLILFSHY